MPSFELAEPRSLDEAFGLLDHHDPSVRPIGGGTALMLMIKSQLFRPVRLVSLRHLAGPFTDLALTDGGDAIRIGAMTTLADLEHSAVIRKHFPIVADAMKALANIRVRNVATVGGNLAHGDPHLDLPPIWMVLDADALILSRNNKRRIPVADIFRGYYETTIADGELIGEIRVPIRRAWRSTYVKVTTRAAHDWPALGIAVSAELDAEHVHDLRIVLSAAVDKPTRLVAAEATLRGREIEEALLRRAAEAAVEEVDIVPDSRGSLAYKQQLLRVHLARAIRAVTAMQAPGTQAP
jgi:aerobic carbon-monoxide dehydrogenase medium subunit